VIQFGSMSITLLIGGLYGMLFATLLWLTRRNRLANRFLALLLLAIALRLVPYIIGYAGFYDVFPWLSFLPYNVSLAIGPLLYLYVRTLSAPNAVFQPRTLLHFIPAAIQFTYYCVVFPQSLAFKNNWDDTVHVPFVLPIEQTLTFVSIAAYWWFSFRHYRGYQTWLAQNVSDREDHHVEWVRNFLIALGITLILWVAMVVISRFVVKLNYFQVFPFYAWLQLLAYYLGTEGYRNARHDYPAWTGVLPATHFPTEPSVALEAPRDAQRESRDWRAEGEKLRQQVLNAALWRNPEITLASLSRKLGSNTSDLSRTINEGLGVNFNELINRMRVDSVKLVLANPDEKRTVLDIAFDAGFSSKASFNRSFKLYTGSTPTEFRDANLAFAGPERLKS
jgi:AraC-like DNA-binding protein